VSLNNNQPTFFETVSYKLSELVPGLYFLTLMVVCGCILQTISLW